MAARDGVWQRASRQRIKFKSTVISDGDFPYLDKTAGISRQMVDIAVK